MKSTLVMLLATVALVAVLGPPTLDVIKGTPNADAGLSGAGEEAEGRTAQRPKDGKRATKARKSDDDDD